jgi:hypothetical protein
MNKPLLFSTVFISVLLSVITAFAQTIPVGSPVVEDAYRREQLLGHVDSSVSFTVRPIFPTAAFKKINVFDPDNSITGNGIVGGNGIYKTADGKSFMQLMPVTWQNQYNTHNPYGWNDGAMIPAAGYQSLFSAGFFAKFHFLSIQFAPEFVYAQNKNFDGFTQAGNEAKVWQAWYNVYNSIDLPERFGTTAYSKLLPGQSSIRITFDPVSIGISTENLWWGPGVENSLLMSNNATGFLHATLNTTRPVKTPIGSFETQLIGGKLTQSDYSPLVPGQTGNYDRLYKPEPNDWRYISGIVFTYHPKWVPGLFLGVDRTFIEYHTDLGHGFSDYFPVITPFLKDNFYNATTGFNTEDAAKRDQLASIFMRWLWTDAGAEIYTEYGREDHNWNTRDLLLDPEHSRAYILGFRKIFQSGNNGHVQVGFEETYLGQSADDLIERPDGTWYVHSQVRAGYTNDGQVLGAGIGPGGELQTLNVDWFKGLKRFGLKIERYEHMIDFYYKAFDPGEVRRHWVDYNIGLSSDWTYNHFIFSGSLLYAKQLNYEWELKNNPDLFYFNQVTFNPANLKLNLNITYRF